jgi:hypothetical protein
MFLADAGEALAERRIDDAAHDDEQDEQRGQRVEVLRCSSRAGELEAAEDRREGEVLSVEAAGVFDELVAELLEQRGEGERQHEQREAVRAQQHPAREQAEDAGDGGGREQQRDRLVPAGVEADEPASRRRAPKKAAWPSVMMPA